VVSCDFAWKSLVGIYIVPIGSMYAIYGIIYHQYTPNVSIYTIHGSYGVDSFFVWGGAKGAISYEQSPAGMPIALGLNRICGCSCSSNVRNSQCVFLNYSGHSMAVNWCVLLIFIPLFQNLLGYYTPQLILLDGLLSTDLFKISRHTKKTCHKNLPWKLAGNSLHTCGPKKQP